MAGETLRTNAQLLADFPDNSSQLINAVDVRNLIWALPSDFGEVHEETDYTQALTQNVWVDVPAAAPSPSFDAGLHWTMDGNGRLVNIYPSVITVPAGLERGAFITVSLSASKAGAPTAQTFEMRLTLDGALLGPVRTFEMGGDQVEFAHSHFVEYVVADQPLVSWEIRNIDSNDDVDFVDWDMDVIGALI